MKINRIRLFVIIGALLLILLIVLSIPHIDTIRSADVSRMEEYPALQNAYTKLCKDNPLYEIVTEDTICIVTVKNLWGAWDRYILPCYSASVPNVPAAGSADSHANLYILAPWAEENFFTSLCRLKVRDFSLYLEPGNNLFVNEQASLTHAGMAPVHYIVYSKWIQFSDAVICNRLPTVSVDYSMATANSAMERESESTTTFTWDYSLRFYGKKIRTGTFVLSIDHTVNA